MGEGTRRKKLLLIGHPNVGKSVIFRRLTGRYVVVSNYPGTTVEISRGEMRLGGTTYEVIDTPGINSLTPHSEDERVTCELLLRENPDVIVQVADAKNVRRALSLMMQLADLGIPVVLVLNMVDEMRARGIEVDARAIAELFHIPVVETVATYGHGIRQLVQAIPRAAIPQKPRPNGRCVTLIERALSGTEGVPLELAVEWMEGGDPTFRREIERLIGPRRVRQLQSAIEEHCRLCPRSLCREIEQQRSAFVNETVAAIKRTNHAPRTERITPVGFWVWTVLLMLGLGVFLWGELGVGIGIPTPYGAARRWMRQHLAGPVQGFFFSHHGGLIYELLFGRPGANEYGLVMECLHLLLLVVPIAIPLAVLMHRSRRFTEKLGELTRAPLTGIPILLIVLLLVYEFVGVTGAQTLVGLLEEIVFGRYLVAGLRELIPPGFIHELLVGPYGLISMGLTYALAIILPVVGTFFIAFGLLEDSGYLPRLAILSDRLLRRMGLNGKAILPMVLGLGCDTMATLTTRILESPKERLIATLLLALGIPCSAQLGVILGLTAGISAGATLIVVLVVVSQLILVGSLAARLLPGRRGDFILEIPPIRVPVLRNVALKTWYRMKWFLGEVVPLFLYATLALFILDQIRVAGRSGIGWIEAGFQPIVVGLLHLPMEAAQAFVMGFLRRDYGAAGLYALAHRGLLSPQQVVVSLVVITLFVPCLANFLVIVKEQGWRRAVMIVGFIVPFALLVGGALSWVLRTWHLLA